MLNKIIAILSVLVISSTSFAGSLFTNPFGGDAHGENGEGRHRSSVVMAACVEAFLQEDENNDWYWNSKAIIANCSRIANLPVEFSKDDAQSTEQDSAAYWKK